MKEIFKPVRGYEGYYKISNMGRLFSEDRFVVRNDGVKQLRKGKEISLVENTDGYLAAKLCRYGSYKTVRIHRLVADSFISKLNESDEVNHINFNRKDNRLENLEICNHKYNVSYSYKSDRYKEKYKNMSGYKNLKARKVKICEFDISFPFIGECAKWLIDNNYTVCTIDNARHEIIKCMNGKKSSYLGLHFKEII